ncbi:MAG: variant-type mycofactocin precursor [Desulfobacula sp.]|jgi:mycofactocin precursor
MNEQEKLINERNKKDGKTDDIFETEEIEIEEMAIDGICGVY